MKPHLEEAWRSLRLADRDIRAFEVLSASPDTHVATVCFHAQQAVEKSLKAVLFSRRIEFERTHDLVRLAQLLKDHGVASPVAEDQLRRLVPFAVAFRYDDSEIEFISRPDVAGLVANVRRWAEEQVRAAPERGEGDATDND